MDEKNWTEKDIPDLSGKTAIVTGASSGTGFEAEDAKTKISKEIPKASLEIIQLDLSSLSSVQSFANTCRNTYNTLDLIVKVNSRVITMSSSGHRLKGHFQPFRGMGVFSLKTEKSSKAFVKSVFPTIC